MIQDQAWRFAAIVLLAVFTAAGCAKEHKESPPPPTAASQPGLVAEEYAETEATIVAIDPATRNVTLRNNDGQVATVQAPGDVDLKKLKVNDKVLLGFYQSISARVLPPGSEMLGASVTAGATPPSSGKGRAWGQQVTVVMKITAVDLKNNTVTLLDANGQTRTIEVKDPAVQARLPNLKVGDLLELTYSEAIAARLLNKR